MLQWEGRRLLVGISEIDARRAIAFDFEVMVRPSDARASKPEQDGRNAVARFALAQFEADRRWLIDLAPPEMLVAVLVEMATVVVDEAAGLRFSTRFTKTFPRGRSQGTGLRHPKVSSPLGQRWTIASNNLVSTVTIRLSRPSVARSITGFLLCRLTPKISPQLRGLKQLPRRR